MGLSRVDCNKGRDSSIQAQSAVTDERKLMLPFINNIPIFYVLFSLVTVYKF